MTWSWCLLPRAKQSTGHSALLRCLSDFYEYVYTAQSSWGFVFISLGDTSTADPLHLFHLRRLRLALHVRSHHASMLPRHHIAAERAQALQFLYPSLTWNFHQFLVFIFFLRLAMTVIFPMPSCLTPTCGSVFPWGWDRCKHSSRNGSKPYTMSEQVCFWTGGVRQVLDLARLTSVTVKMSVLLLLWWHVNP